jgi:hypothetical protein
MKFQKLTKNWQRACPPLFVIAIEILLRLAHNFSFGVDFTPFATKNNATS